MQAVGIGIDNRPQQWLKLANLEMAQQASTASFNTVIDTCAQTNNYYCLCNACDGNNWLTKYYEQAYLQANLKFKGHVVLHKVR